MNCVNHPGKESIDKCCLCGDFYCEECMVTLEDRYYCKDCLTARVSARSFSAERLSDDTSLPEKQRSYQEQEMMPEKKSRFWAFLFSIIPGVGYLYLGLMNRGLQTMILFFGSIFVASFIGFDQLMALVVPVVMFYTIFDTQQLVKIINSGTSPEDEPFFDIKKIPVTQNWIAYTLIVIGVLAIFNNVLPSFPFWWQVKRMIPPILIIGLGTAILYRNTKKES